jgi:hypothetical protein
MDEIAERDMQHITNIKMEPKRSGLDVWLNLLKKPLKIQSPVQ